MPALCGAAGCGSGGSTGDFGAPGSGASGGAGGGGGAAATDVSVADGLAGGGGKDGAAGLDGSAGKADGGGGNAADGGDGGGPCKSDAQCSGATPYCQTSTGKCVACDDKNPQQTCKSGTCCGIVCIDTTTDSKNCGGCAKACDLPNADSSCSAASCVVTKCKPGFLDCDLKAANGCETPATDGGAGCACKPNATEPCYSGPQGTENVGPCHAGTRTCDAAGTSWGPCQGEVVPGSDVCTNSIDDDCNGTVNDGFPNATGCVCKPNASESCYDGPSGTQGKGECKAGTHTCQPSGAEFGACGGQVTPVKEICGNGKDDNCDGQTDENPDLDGDGWGACSGDCCDVAGPACADPKLVNPGAFEVAGNQVDDDCDGTVDNPLAACDNGLASNSSNAVDYAKAIDLCQTTVESPPLAQKKWGVIGAQLLLANGSGTPNANSRAIRPGFGTAIAPKAGTRLAVLSTGRAADSNDTNPSFAAFQGGQNMGTSSGVPADWLAANGGNFPNAPGCPDPQGGNTAHDPILLKIRIRVPTNAQSFSLSTYFFSSEYPEWVCSPFNDFFVALLDSTWNGNPKNPTDKNLAFYDPPPVGPPYYPVGVNLAFGNTGLFRQCLNGPTGCGGGSVAGTTTACTGINELAGTGFDTVNPPSQFPADPGWCGSSNRLGGGTGWLVTRGNLNGGETIEIRFAVWDTGDPWYDSLVLLDNWAWSVTASQPGTGG
jgi:hypothetical protein